MRVILTASLLLFLLPSRAHPFFSRAQTSAWSLAIGGADFSNIASPSTALSNPAALGKISKGFFYCSYKNYYNLEKLSCHSLSLVLPYKSLGGAIYFESFGEGSFYREREFSLSLGGEAYEGLYLGARFKYLHLSIDGARFSNSGASGDFGFGYDTQKGLLLGICFQNLLVEPATREDFDLKTLTGMGIGVFPYDNLYFCLSYVRSEGRQHWHFGQEILVSDFARLRCGLLSQPTRYTAGVGISWERFSLDVGYLSHPVLGATSQADLRVDLFRKEKR